MNQRVKMANEVKRGSLRTLLASRLKTRELESVYKSYDIIGDIAIIRLPESSKHLSKIVAEAIMRAHKRVKTVLRQDGPVLGDFRTRKLGWVVGETKTETVHKEHGCLLKVDLEKCYFSPRLSYERNRIAQRVQPGEVVVNMFAGVGSYSIVIARHCETEKIFSIDINPTAVRYMQENIELNKVEDRVIPILGDAKGVIEERLQGVADRILMPLPKRANEYLNYALMALRPTGRWIHYYDFAHAKKPEESIEKVKSKVSKNLEKTGLDFEIAFQRIVREVGPNWFQVVLDLAVSR